MVDVCPVPCDPVRGRPEPKDVGVEAHPDGRRGISANLTCLPPAVQAADAAASQQAPQFTPFVAKIRHARKRPSQALQGGAFRNAFQNGSTWWTSECPT